jgi:hypothetical protein
MGHDAEEWMDETAEPTLWRSKRERESAWLLL